MSQGDKTKYTDRQKRQAAHIEEGYQKKGVSEDEAEGRAWATVNKMDGGGKKPGGSGRGKKTNREPAEKGGKKSATSQSHATRVKAGKKAAVTRKRNKK